MTTRSACWTRASDLTGTPGRGRRPVEVRRGRGRYRRHSMNHAGGVQTGCRGLPLGAQYRSATRKLVDFNFKPRCFAECGGLTACGGLVGSDDSGFPTNWNRLSREQELRTGEPLPPPSQPVRSRPAACSWTTATIRTPAFGRVSCPFTTRARSSRRQLCWASSSTTASHSPKGLKTTSTCTPAITTVTSISVISATGTPARERYSDLKFPLNNAALSHDGKTMLVSGDSNKFALYRQNELVNQFTLNYDSNIPGVNWGGKFAGGRVTRHTRFNLPDPSESIDQNIYVTRNGDHGFYNSFSENDSQFATLFQNGVCLLYDIRNTAAPLTEITSTRPHSHNGAFRVCRFSYGLDDLLFVSEHQGRVHVVDTRNFVNHQVIMIPDTLESASSQPSTENFDRMMASQMDANVNPRSRDSSSTSLSRRRASAPADTVEPWITPALSIPLKYLQPDIVPFPRVVDRIHSDFGDRYRPTSRGGSRGGSSRSLSSANRWDTNYDFSMPAPQQDTSTRDRSGFNVRRVSTSSAEKPQDQSLLAQHQRLIASPEGNPADDSPMVPFDGISDSRPFFSRRSNYLYGHDDTILDPLSQRHLHPYGSDFRYQSRGNQRTGTDFSESDFVDENNISGIDWVEDANGDSLVIGTDYGIFKWNVNSWARRSFSSYDFC
ncbi:Gid11p KNAG_0A02790 [Huiozyma naganishii CBS 8797]|uniref:DUF2415 domain-containing protein n=1 Tax=Huiozyma naganishii (strain ATCC MYA-139 / BCRC 22969 / CBS 8797 / KCTC 17520 / NBRC 10181 / NCYC 3082 / Yp74L-3) TaxID=1071383 RepID=J7REK9_HUIN7|nr:hypothetical protein KNAG_0A02790 [Kazachstania naganishii CBS 8797]CCK67968.1 hypothetical protein KNAG_0A02790 [Kazachstania naganishii CBS 8797]